MKKTILHSILAVALLLAAFFQHLLALNNPTVEGNCTVDYCQSYSNFPWEDWISKVELADLSHASGKSVYSNFTNQTAHVNKGQTYTLKLTTGFSYYTSDEYWTVWIDINHDGVLEPQGEGGVAGKLDAPPNGTANAVLNLALTIPTYALTGPTRMRISMTRGDYALPCEILAFGEVEDYTIDIGSQTQLPNLSIPTYEAFPTYNNCYVLPGEDFGSFAGLVLNSGNVAAGPFDMVITISKDNQPSADDITWEVIQYAGLQPNSVAGFGITNLLPASLTTGIYYVILRLDKDNLVAESNELDNSSNRVMRVGALDFALTNVTGIPVSVAPGSNLDITLEVTNLVPFPLLELVNNVTLKAFLSTDNVFQSLNDPAIGTANLAFNQFSNGPLFNGGKASGIISAQIPNILQAGNYFIFVSADYGCESSIDNNLSNAIPIQITTGTPGNYCTSTSAFPWQDWIAKVDLADLSNASGKTPYSNFTNLTAHLNAGQSYPVKLTTGYSYFTFDEYWRIWIDLNGDFDFTDPGETIFSGLVKAPANGTTSAVLTDNLTIPASASPITTRMRVSMKRGGYPSPCETLPFGEVEDYIVTLGNGAPCSISFAIDNIQCQDGGTSNNPNDDTFTFKILVLGGNLSVWNMVWDNGSASGLYTLPKTMGPFPIANYPNGFNFTIFDFDPTCSQAGSMTPPAACSTPPPANYCASTSNFPWEDWIGRVKLKTIDNTSGKSSYSDFTALNTILQMNAGIQVTLTTGFSYFTWNEYWRIWIDLNHDNDFTDAGETVFEGILNKPPNGTVTASLNGFIQLPTTVLTGATRMRVSMKRNAFASPCETLPFGEVEDYTVNIVNNLTGDDEVENRADNLTFEAVPERSSVNLFGAYHEPVGVAEVIFEKSTDGENFLPLAMLPGEVSDAVKATDNKPVEGFNFYRLRLNLASGEVRLSPVRIVSLEVLDDVAIFPNPAQSEIFIHFQGEIPAGASVQIFDVYGQLVLEKRLAAGEAAPVRMELERVGEGTYFAFVQRDGRKAIGKRFLITR